MPNNHVDLDGIEILFIVSFTFFLGLTKKVKKVQPLLEKAAAV